MRKISSFIMILMTPYIVHAQVQNDADGNFDSTTYVETNGTTNSASTVLSTNTNTNLNTNTNTNTYSALNAAPPCGNRPCWRRLARLSRPLGP